LAADSEDKTLSLYEGHNHHLLADLDKEGVMGDIMAWLDERVPHGAAAGSSN
jgi:acylglycerol lipase